MMLDIKKEQSVELKGIAILMMLFLHLFNTLTRVEECTTFVNFINGKPLVYALARVAGLCVPIYLFVSGYGLAKTADTATGKRILRLYKRYWYVFLAFIPLACWLRPDQYPGSAQTLLLNFLALSCSYNGEWWFIFPYVVLLILSRHIIDFTRRHTLRTNAILFVIVFLVSLLHKMLVPWSSITAVKLLKNTLFVLPPFYAGCICALHPSLPLPRGGRFTLVWIVLLCLVRMMIGASDFNVFFCLLFVFLYLQLKVSAPMQKVLVYFGRYSLYMWLTHTFYAYYLFHEEIYSLRYPLLMYVVLVAVSLATAMLLEGIWRFVTTTGRATRAEQ